MKRNNKLSGKLAKYFAIAALPMLLASCGSYYAYYSDGIYGERPPERFTVVEHYEQPPQRNAYSPSRYQDYFREKAQQYSNADGKFTHFTDVDSYTSDHYNTGEGKSYGGWGSNATQVTVNVYDNYWNAPYYGYNHYWGYGAWYPYQRYNPYYRNHLNWGISIGWGNYYNPYWNWYDGYYPYYGYGYYGNYYPRYYYPYYGGRYYPRDYYYSPNGSYNRGYGEYYGGRGRAIVRDNSRRGDSNRYYNYENSRNSQGYYNRNTTPSRGYENRSGNYGNRNNNYDYNNSRNDLPTRGYENRNYNNSGRSYDNGTSRGYNNSGNGGNSGGGSYRSSNRR
ncbi:hypothetical protein [Capnocytophaga sp.]|uniref:hypothetical protein n=1 Tax=Capnocytophaga sp. TaxID=44737 RepID=UPI0026DD8F6B|nr:hypothetical protein [Capnocytophaga sp.]MDO5104887.1 hypothetical protein [Capnocytophaga sp.]